MVTILLAEGADVHGSNKMAQTALHLAHRHAQVAKLLLAAGASASVRDAYGATPIDYAIRNGDTNTLTVLTNALVQTNR